MDLTLLKTHELKGNGYFLGLQGENKSEVLNIIIKDETLLSKWAYIEFQNNDSEKWSTPRLTINGNKLSYEILSGLLQEGKVKVQVVFRDEEGFVWKSYSREFVVGEALCVSDNLPQENPDFISEAQKLLDECEETKKNIEETSSDLTKRVETCEETCKEIRESETLRVEAENKRISNENARVEQEAKRVENEALRGQNEETRLANELVRRNNEDVRLANERQRQANETLRVEAEQSRQGIIDRLNNELLIKDKLLQNLSLANEGKTFLNNVDETIAYQKSNPGNVLPYAIVNSVGGASYVVDETFRHTPVTNLKSVGKNLIDISKCLLREDTYISISKVDDTSITITTTEEYTGNGFISTGKLLKELASSLVVGKTYVLSATTQSASKDIIYLYNSSDNSLSQVLVFGGKFTLTKDMFNSRVYFYGLSQQDSEGTGDCVISNIQIEEGEVATNYEPYVEHSLPIPSEVQALEGYGLGVNSECYNYIDFKNRKFIQRVGIVDLGTLNWISATTSSNGRFVSTNLQYLIKRNSKYWLPGNILCTKYITTSAEIMESVNPIDKTISVAGNTYSISVYDIELINKTPEEIKNALSGIYLIYELATPIETDISQYINNNLIEVVEGGSITFENEYKQETPSNITYQTKI